MKPSGNTGFFYFDPWAIVFEKRNLEPYPPGGIKGFLPVFGSWHRRSPLVFLLIRFIVFLNFSYASVPASASPSCVECSPALNQVQNPRIKELVKIFDQFSKLNSLPHLSPKLVGMLHKEIYRGLTQGKKLGTQVYVSVNSKGIVTAVFREFSSRELSGFLQFDFETGEVLLNLGSEFGLYKNKLIQYDLEQPRQKLLEILKHYSFPQKTPFEFYYETNAQLDPKSGTIAEPGTVTVFGKNVRVSKEYNRDLQKDRCGTDLFWEIFNLVIYGSADYSLELR